MPQNQHIGSPAPKVTRLTQTLQASEGSPNPAAYGQSPITRERQVRRSDRLISVISKQECTPNAGPALSSSPAAWPMAVLPSSDIDAMCYTSIA